MNRNPLAGLLPNLFENRDEGDTRNTVEKSAPGSLRFDGLFAGLFGRTGSGDRNDPCNYVLFCPQCGSALGVLARWKPWPDGTRAVRCMAKLEEGGADCDIVTVLDRYGKILRIAPGAAYDAWLRTVHEKQAHARKLEADEMHERLRKTGTNL